MSSEAVVTPREVPRTRSMFGPVLLIGIGLVFLLVNVGRLSGLAVAVAFAKYWPVLIILWGVSKLLEHWEARRKGTRAAGIGFGGVLTLLLLIVLGTGATSAYRHSAHINWSGVREEMSRDGKFGLLFGRQFDFTQSLEHPLPANGAVRVIAQRGSVRVLPSTDRQVHLTLNKTVLAYQEAEAAAINERVAPRITIDGPSLEIDASRRSDWAGARMNMEIRVPPGARLELVTSHGDVFVRGRQAPVQIETSHGSVRLEDQAGDAGVRLHHADFDARNVRGNVTLAGRIDETTLADVDGTVDVRGELFGDVQLNKIAKGLYLRSTRTELQLAKLDGEVRSSDGQMRITSALGPVRLRTSSKDVEVDEVSGDVKIDNRNGEVALRPDPRAPLGTIDITNRSGEVRLTLPGHAGFQIEAHTDEGDIRSDFELTETKDGNDTRASGTVNKGGPRVSVSTEHGTVRIRRH